MAENVKNQDAPDLSQIEVWTSPVVPTLHSCGGDSLKDTTENAS